MKFSEIKNTLKHRFEESPEQVILAGLTAIAVVGKIAESFASTASKRAYAKKMNQSLKYRR